MSKPTWAQAADQFLEFFHSRGHVVVPSSSLVLTDDPTLLFTNAGMVPFKGVFLGQERRSYQRAASLQKCMRVQGKHNDLEDVGPSPYHNTFFFMLGNFSFGDYFKDDAVSFAWELMTRHFRIDPARLVVTVLHTDEDAVAAWTRVGVPASRIHRMGEATNFWMMGETGPCGPNSELHYDWGSQHCTCGAPDCSVVLDNGCARWLEVWNLVFMQFDQQPDGRRTPLPRPGVDTGMGLERMVAALEGINDIFGTSLFAPLMDRLTLLLGHAPDQRAASWTSYRVLADHARAMTFLMGDGVVPGNEGRGYVLRMIMRRAMRFGRAVGLTAPVLADLASVVVAQMGDVYPDLRRQQEFILAAASGEEARFSQTLASGLGRLEEVIAQVGEHGGRVIPGEEVFRLYDTYGFPVEMTRDVARERGLQIDEPGFGAAMAEQRARARAAQTFTVSTTGQQFADLASRGVTTEFLGYTKLSARATVAALLVQGQQVDEAGPGAEVQVVLDRTPFYAEAGGQVGDTGRLRRRNTVAEVLDTQRAAGGVIVHRARIEDGRLRVGQSVRAEVDGRRRVDIMRNHTATHLLHKALQEVLGEHARQAGSLVAPDRLRFDFIHLAPLTSEQQETVERRVNEKILDDLPVRARSMSYEQALALGAMALFGEKYGDRVRVISIDGYSRELCGGTHLSRTAQIGLFKITSEGGVAAGVRRLEAVTGRGTYELLRRQEQTVRALADELKTAPEDVPDRVRRLSERAKELEQLVKSDQMTGEARAAVVADMVGRSVDVDGIVFVIEGVHVSSAEVLRALADRVREVLRHRGRPGVVLLVSPAGEVVGARTADAAVHVGELVKLLTAEFGGSGGGRAEFAQGGLKDATRAADLVARGRDREFLASVVRRSA